VDTLRISVGHLIDGTGAAFRVCEDSQGVAILAFSVL
jgi:hypothetical protein